MTHGKFHHAPIPRASPDKPNMPTKRKMWLPARDEYSSHCLNDLYIDQIWELIIEVCRSIHTSYILPKAKPNIMTLISVDNRKNLTITHNIKSIYPPKGVMEFTTMETRHLEMLIITFTTTCKKINQFVWFEKSFQNQNISNHLPNNKTRNKSDYWWLVAWDVLCWIWRLGTRGIRDSELIWSHPIYEFCKQIAY